MHDATLLSVSVDWSAGTAVVRLLRDVDGKPEVSTFEARGLRHLDLARRQPWGPSVSVNTLECLSGRLSIEMQSGDLIVVEADEIVSPP
jgi:hypothetical protein